MTSNDTTTQPGLTWRTATGVSPTEFLRDGATAYEGYTPGSTTPSYRVVGTPEHPGSPRRTFRVHRVVRGRALRIADAGPHKTRAAAYAAAERDLLVVTPIRAEPPRADMAAPEPHPAADPAAVFRPGDRVVIDATPRHPGDRVATWTVSFVVERPGREPLVGLSRGDESLRTLNPASLLRHAPPAAEQDLPPDELLARALRRAKRDALVHLRDVVLPATVEDERSNHAFAEHFREPAGEECWNTWRTEDINDMINHAIGELA